MILVTGGTGLVGSHLLVRLAQENEPIRAIYRTLESIEKTMDEHERAGQDLNQHFSIIQLEQGTTINQNRPIFKKLAAVKADLGMPLFDLFTKG